MREVDDAETARTDPPDYFEPSDQVSRLYIYVRGRHLDAIICPTVADTTATTTNSLAEHGAKRVRVFAFAAVDREDDLGEHVRERAIEERLERIGDHARIVAEHAGAPRAENETLDTV